MSDRRVFSPTELAQLDRCEQQMLFDRRFGVKRSEGWRKRSAEGNAVHAAVHRQVTHPATLTPRWWLWGLVAAMVILLISAVLLR